MFRVAILAFLVLWTTVPLHAQDTLPPQMDALAVRVAQTVADEDADAFHQLFVELGPARYGEEGPRSRIRAAFWQLLHEGGGLDYEDAALETRPDGTAALNVNFLMRATGERSIITIELGALDPPSIAGLATGSDFPFDPNATRLSMDEAVATLDSYIEQLADADLFSGNVLLARDTGEVLLERSYGFANRRFDVANTLDTAFDMGSMTKMFTAVMILGLVEEGALSLDDTIDAYLDEGWLPQSDLERITIEQLLTHRSGLGTHFTPEFFDTSPLRFDSVSDYQRVFGDIRPTFEPGTSWEYSNAGYILLGAVIEEVTGNSYDQALLSRIVEPAGLENTGCFSLADPGAHIATGYLYELDEDGQVNWSNNTLFAAMRGSAAGGCFTTARDLLRFDQALYGGALISTQMLEAALTDYSGVPGRGYGYGFTVAEGPLGVRAGHEGGFPGVGVAYARYPEKGVVVIILSNMTPALPRVDFKAQSLLARVE